MNRHRLRMMLKLQFQCQGTNSPHRYIKKDITVLIIALIIKKPKLYLLSCLRGIKDIQTWAPPSLVFDWLSENALWKAFWENLTPTGAWISATEVDRPLFLRFLASPWLSLSFPPSCICKLAHVTPGVFLEPGGPLELTPCKSIRQLSLTDISDLEDVPGGTPSHGQFLMTSKSPGHFLSSLRPVARFVVGKSWSLVMLPSAFFMSMSDQMSFAPTVIIDSDETK